ncbi:tandem-95 repeat protein [Cellulomonas sp. NPDC089187]|uniref:Ig-like domain-containing protein n=1 Tax=Cellulomonas sp. NPDC089187 TaxID=3154970 RepID=UPI0034332312
MSTSRWFEGRWARSPRRSAALVTVAALALTGLGVSPASAEGEIGSATGLTLKVTADGTANKDGSWDSSDQPGYDSSPTNGIVRTHDYVTYQWGYSVATAGDVTLVQTLPDGMGWVTAASTGLCAEGAGAVSADRRTLSCTRAGQATGASTMSVQAEVLYAAHGQQLSSVLSSAGAPDSAPATVTASATPKVSLGVRGGSNGYYERGGVAGYTFWYQIHLYQEVDPIRGVRGSEALADGFTMTLDPSTISPSAILHSCPSGNAQNIGGYQVYDRINGSNQTAANSVPQRGDWSCAQDTPGGPITVTVHNAITDLRSYPTHYSNGSALSSTMALISGNELFTWLPATEYTEARALNMQTSGFDPESVSGQSNFGTGYAKGQEPGAAPITNVNNVTVTIPLTEGVVPRLSYTWDPVGNPWNMNNPIPAGASSTSAGDAPLAPGDSIRYGGYITNQSTSGIPGTNIGTCVVWDESILSIGDSPQFYSQRGHVAMEYAHLDVSTDAARKSYDCGQAADGAVGWSTTVAGAGGADQVNAMRVSYSNLAAGVSNYLGVVLTRTDKTLPDSTPLPVFWQLRSTQSGLAQSTFNPDTLAGNLLGARAKSIATTVAADLSWDTASGAPGTPRTLTVQPGLSHPDATASDVSVTVTLPAGVTPVEGSWNDDLTPTAVTNADGSTTLTFALGDLTGEDIAPVTFDVNISARLAMPTSVTATAVIASVSDFRPVSYRTSTATLGVNAAKVFAVAKTGSTVTATPGVPVTYTVSWLNGLEAGVGTGALVDVLPFDGDGRGTDALTGIALTDLDVDADMAVRVQFTTADPADTLDAVKADPSGETVIGWAEWPTDGSVPAGVTALRFLTGDIEPGMGGEVTLTAVPGLLGVDGATVNNLYGTVTGLDAAITAVSPVTMSSGGVQLSGTVYADDDYSWTREAGESGLAEVQITVTGHSFGANGVDEGGAGDDIPVTAEQGLTATSTSDGSYTVDGLPPGRWTLTATTPSGMLPGQTPSTELVLESTERMADLDFGFVDELVAPVAAPDNVRVSAGDSVNVPVLANDTLDDSAVITGLSTPTAGTATHTDDTVTYTAPADGSGTVTVDYTVRDKARQTATGTLSIEVVPLPTASPALYRVGQVATALPDIAGLFTGDDASISAVSTPAHGAVELVDGVVVYTPEAGYAGADQFSYTVTDSMGKSAGAVITLTVVAAPTTTDLAIATRQDTPVTADLGALASGDGLTLAVTTAAEHGTLLITDPAAGLVEYTPDAGYIGTDQIVLTWTDSVGQTVTTTLSVEVRQTPAANPDTAATVIDAPVTVDVLANDSGVDLTLTAVIQPEHGTVAIAEGALVYTPQDGWSGVDTLTYDATDRWGGEVSATVTVTVYSAPVAPEVTGRTGVQMPLVLDPAAVQSTQTDGLPRAPWTVTAIGEPSEGTAVLNPDGSITVTSAAPTSGEITLEYTVTDAMGQTATGTLTVTVLTLTVEDIRTRTPFQTPVTVDVLAGAQGTGVTLASLAQPGIGSARIDESGTITYLPADGFAGADSFTVTVTDEVGQTAVARVDVTVEPASQVLAEEPPVRDIAARFLAVTGLRLSDTLWAALAVLLIGWRVVVVSRRRQDDQLS